MLDELIENINVAVGRKVNDIHTALIGKITFVNEDCTVDIKPIGYIFKENKDISEYPKLYRVPLCFPMCNSGGVEVPVAYGDTCLVIFCECDLEKWRTNATGSEARHQLTDAIAIPGVSNRMSGMKKDCVKVRYKNNCIKISDSDISFGVELEG